MQTITYIGHAGKVTWCGVELPRGEAVRVDQKDKNHAHMLAKAETNPHFEIGSVSEDAPGDERSAMRERLTEMGVTVPGRAGAKWMADKLKALDSA